MKRTAEEMLQDYLDGRLGDEARAEFEAMMESDPKLAERVESYRGIGQALREEEPELPPGFHARARARFEESRRGGLRMPRLLSWEAAGLATAAVLACVLFIPYFFERDGKGDERPPTETIWEAPAAEEAVEDGDAQPALEKEKIGMEFAPAPAADSTDDALVLEGEKREKKGAQPPLPTVQADAATAEPRGEKGEIKRAREAPVAPTREYIPLRPGVAEPGTVTVLQTEEEWRTFAEKNGLGRMVYDPARRWVLIGTREFSFQCLRIKKEKLENSYRITLRPADDPRFAARFGCAVSVGNDHRTIEVLPPVEEQK